MRKYNLQAVRQSYRKSHAYDSLSGGHANTHTSIQSYSELEGMVNPSVIDNRFEAVGLNNLRMRMRMCSL